MREKHFGVSFDEKAKQFKHLRDNANQYLQIKAMYEKLPQLKGKSRKNFEPVGQNDILANKDGSKEL